MLKKKGWSTPQPSNKEVWSSHQPSIRNRTPPLHALKQEYSFPQVVCGKRTELLSRRELHCLLVRRFALLRKVRRPHPKSCRLGRVTQVDQARAQVGVHRYLPEVSGVRIKWALAYLKEDGSMTSSEGSRPSIETVSVGRREEGGGRSEEGGGRREEGGGRREEGGGRREEGGGIEEGGGRREEEEEEEEEEEFEIFFEGIIDYIILY